MQREAALAKNLKLPSKKLNALGSKSLSQSTQSNTRTPGWVAWHVANHGGRELLHLIKDVVRKSAFDLCKIKALNAAHVYNQVTKQKLYANFECQWIVAQIVAMDTKQFGSEPVQVQEAGKGDDQEEELQISEALASTKQRKQWGLQGFGSAESLGLPCVGRAALNDPRCMCFCGHSRYAPGWHGRRRQYLNGSAMSSSMKALITSFLFFGQYRALIAVRKLNPDHLMMGLKRVFERYNLWQHGTNK
eukprot:scaffold312936_cov24-Tisochrysis_lutea.AAC.1